jgi:hypothetical protein
VLITIVMFFITEDGPAMKNLVFVVLAVVLLQGCASSYKAQDSWGGYSESQLNKDIFKVRFHSQGFDAHAPLMEDMLMLRNADLTLANGFKYFAILEAEPARPHNAANKIMCFNTKPAQVISYDAEFLFNSLSEKYKI